MPEVQKQTTRSGLKWTVCEMQTVELYVPWRSAPVSAPQGLLTESEKEERDGRQDAIWRRF
jgi:hypothetical protein